MARRTDSLRESTADSLFSWSPYMAGSRYTTAFDCSTGWTNEDVATAAKIEAVDFERKLLRSLVSFSAPSVIRSDEVDIGDDGVLVASDAGWKADASVVRSAKDKYDTMLRLENMVDFKICNKI